MRHFTKVLLGLMLMVLASCGGGPASRDVGAPGPGANHLLGDTAPYDWGWNHPYNQQVHGIDISRWQGNINWHQVRNSGISFAFIKATEGGDHTDPNFRRYWYEAGQARIPRGAYHYYYFCRTGAEQARWFIRNVPRERGSLPPVLDIEWTNSQSCPRRPPPTEIKREANIFLNIVGRHYGQRPIIYTTVDFYHENNLGELRGEFWLRSVAAHPNSIYPGQRWGFWQYTGTGTVPGISGNVDLNTFAGSASDWRRWLQTRLTR